MPPPNRPTKRYRSYSRVAHLSKNERKNLIRKTNNVKYMFEPNEEAVSVNLNKFTPNYTPEVPRKNRNHPRTPNRRTVEPWGKPGYLPGEPPKLERMKGGRTRKSRRLSQRRQYNRR